jgi:exopolyphosphatase / guanosine-5'-triphosphate,3'-diphosphate pyrophosphatase
VELERHLAIIDLGSNTARLISLGYTPRKAFKLKDELRQVVRLSAGMTKSKIIRADAFSRGLDTLKTFRAYCDAAGIKEIRAVATSALRQAANGDSFLAAAREAAGLELAVLSGEREAFYGALAVANSTTLEDGFVLDVGGGSAQVSRLEARRYAEGKSWPLGAVRLTEMFLASDPPKKKEVKALVKHVREALKGAPRGFGDARALVGMGGTMRNLAEVQKKREGYPLDLVHGYVFGKETFSGLVADLVGMTVAQRRNVPGLSADRADIIAAGALVVREVLDLSGAEALTVSGRGLREGLFYPYFLEAEPYLIDNVRRFSVENLARLYYDRPAHNAHVEKLSLLLFDGLKRLHGYGEAERELLAAAAIVHDVGMAVSYYDHHKHGYYLIMSAALPGYSHREQALIALLVRYHRKGKPTDQGLAPLLEGGDMARVNKLAALLRMAEYLERSKAQLVCDLRCHLSEAFVQIEVFSQGDARVEIQETKRRSELFAAAYGVEVEVVPGH